MLVLCQLWTSSKENLGHKILLIGKFTFFTALRETFQASVSGTFYKTPSKLWDWKDTRIGQTCHNHHPVSKENFVQNLCFLHYFYFILWKFMYFTIEYFTHFLEHLNNFYDIWIIFDQFMKHCCN